MNVPLRGKDRRGDRTLSLVELLYPRPPRIALDVWMCNASVFVRLAEQILTIDQLQWPAEILTASMP